MIDAGVISYEELDIGNGSCIKSGVVFKRHTKIGDNKCVYKMKNGKISKPMSLTSGRTCFNVDDDCDVSRNKYVVRWLTLRKLSYILILLIQKYDK